MVVCWGNNCYFVSSFNSWDCLGCEVIDMRFFKRLMEIKEQQLQLEGLRTFEIMRIHHHVEEILELMKGGVKDGKNKNKPN